RRQRLVIAEQRALHLLAGSRGLDDHPRVVPPGGLDRLVELALSRRGRDPDARAEPGGLHPDRLAEPRSDLPPALLSGSHVVDLRNAVAPEDVLEDQLVHAARRGLDVGTGVGDTQDLEQPLDAAVLAPGAVQDREGGVAAEQPAGRYQADLLSLGRPGPVTADRHLDGLVAGLAQTGCHRSRGTERDLVLARDAAGQDRDSHGAGEVAGLVPPEIVTVSPRCPREPAGGNSEITMPTWVGSVVGCSVTAGVKPALLSAVTAALRLWQTTSGTVMAPVEAKIVTCEPRFTSLPAAGLWLSTLPCGCVESRCTSTPERPALFSAVSAAWSSRPTTFGTVTLFGPREISRLTGCVVESCVPADGSVPIASPRGTEFEYCWTTFTLKPAFSRRFVASASFRLVTLGTATMAGPELTLSVTVDPSSALPPPRSVGIGSCSTT